jgi:hypothetical protein
MAACPLCSTRTAKRYCPAKGEKICPVCCGEKREVEIYCPSDCSYLRAGRDYESDKRSPDTALQARSRDFTDAWLYRFTPILDVISRAVIAERLKSQWLVDNDVIEVFKALAATMRTLSSGIYYESLPEGPLRQSLFHKVKEVLDELMQPQERIGDDAMKVKEAVDVLDFLTFAAQMNSSTRPKSRRYLDWLATTLAASSTAEESPSGLILP